MSDPTLPSNSPNQAMSDNPASDGGDPIHDDPLLQSGSFIEPTFKDEHAAGNGDVKSPNPRERAAEQEAEPSSAQSLRPTKSPSAPERPEWLPEGWGFDFRIRTSGVSAGTYDRYYIDPATNRRFRSKKEVEHYLETGMLKRPAPDTSENGPSSSSRSQKGKKSASNARNSPGLNFDLMNVPNQIRWSVTDPDPEKNKWCAFSGGEIVPESMTDAWKAYCLLDASK